MLVDGHGRAFYVAWGTVDWTLAGAFWVGGIVLAAVTAEFTHCETNTRTCDSNSNVTTTSRQYRNGAWALGVTSAVALGVGGFFGWRGAHNIGISHQMLQPPPVEP